MEIVIEAQTQKLCKPSIEITVPERNARELVNEVMVIEAPEWPKAFLNRSSGDKSKDIQSIEFMMTNISSTPIPSIRIGIA